MLTHSFYESPLGKIEMIFEDMNLIYLDFFDTKIIDEKLENIPLEEESIYKPIHNFLNAYFLGKKVDTKSISCLLKGTSFSLKVWQLLEEIPYGSVTTYGKIAKELEKRTGKRVSPRAVGHAVGKNPLLIIVPCHRVLPASLRIGNYRAGVKRKEALLLLEHASFSC